jgi:4-hydroxybenzoate polyprenyltransferase
VNQFAQQTWNDLLVTMRPKHWLKNVLVLVALVFAEKMGDVLSVAQAVSAFCAFCLLSSANYLLNDLVDRKNDIHHPAKQIRPIAQNRLGPIPVLLAWLALTATGLGVTFVIRERLFHIAVAFALLGFLYTLFLKHLVILDAFAIAAGYLLRTVAGAYAIDVPISSWLLICTLLLSLFLGLTKRSFELKLLAENAPNHRPSLAYYNTYLLDQMSAVITSAILITYTLYTLSSSTADNIGGLDLFLTVPFVLYGIFRYLYLVHQKQVTSTLEAALIADRPLMTAVIIYVVVTFLVLYF